jgi:hypothetical protein
MLHWTLAILIPADMLAMGFGCGGCHPVCLSLLAGAWIMAGVAVLEVRRGLGAPLLLSLNLLYAIPHCPCANVIHRWWMEPLGANLHGYAFSRVGLGCAVEGFASGLFSNTIGRGPGGSIRVLAGNLQVSDGGTISANSTGAGDADSIRLQIGEVFRSERGSVTVGADQAVGGNIQLTAGALLQLSESGLTAHSEGGLCPNIQN